MESLIQKIIPLMQQYGVKKAAFFGSYSRGDYNEKSDIDILIQPPKGMGLKFVRLKRELQDKLKKDVDLLSYNGLSPYLKESILKSEKRFI